MQERKKYFDWVSESFLTSWPCKCNIPPPCVYASASQGRHHVPHIAGLRSNMFCFSWAKRITDTQKPARQSGIISGALCWWNQITCSYSQRAKSQETHIMGIYLAIGRHNVQLDEPIHHRSQPFLSPRGKKKIPPARNAWIKWKVDDDSLKKMKEKSLLMT